ncbi:hypothetical protein EJP67_18605 [Variovorax guangxiensis]|uniref:Uncharacterized protein n=1 Tax=Variovorax guangxiensis TaxID=1775474 RepID=A0A3S0ZB71_9BURK|nr:hypothetical protein [Variovorax guangxiensis]RUR69073.1 hypothetical protein EJP67_18605 [Variovorax guangxiensis]
MADKLVPSQDDTGAIRRFRDMGDGTWAEVTSPAAGAAGAAGYPAGAVPVAASTQTSNATSTATLPAAVGKTTYVTSFQISGTGATAGNFGGGTLSGVLGGSQSIFINIPAGASTAAIPVVVNFNPPLPASAVNTAIQISAGAFGAGSSFQSVSIQGFQL